MQSLKNIHVTICYTIDSIITQLKLLDVGYIKNLTISNNI